MRLSKPAVLVLFVSVLLAACSSDVTGPNRAPVAKAGLDLQVNILQTINLDPKGSFDPDGDELVKFEWTLISAPTGTQVGIENGQEKIASLSPDRPGVWLVQLIVGDSKGLESEPDVVQIRSVETDCQPDTKCGTCQTCDQNRNCVDDLNRDEDCPFCQECAAGGTCQAQAAGNDVKGECINGEYCDGIEACNGAGGCQNGSNPCPGLTCDEVNDTCSGCQNHDQCPLCQECNVSEVCVDQAVTDDLKEECAEDSCKLGYCDGQGACAYQPLDTDCDDSLYCTGADTCDASGNCSNHTGDPCPQTECNTCQEDVDSCFDPDTTPCSGGGADCTSSTFCDGAGSCVGTPDDDYCDQIDSGSLCLPECSPDNSGCVSPPDQLFLDCADPVTIPDSSDCVITLVGGDTTNQADCLSCSAKIGPTVVDFSDFGDDIGKCDLDGWAMLPGLSQGTFCRDHITDCTEGGSNQDCCDDFSKMCTTDLGGFTLVQDKRTDCGTKHEEWRIHKTFDFSGLSGIQVCFDLADNGATIDEGVLIIASDGGNTEQIFCLNSAPVPLVDDTFFHMCSEVLPGWANDNSEVKITIIVHSETDDDVIYLDNVRVQGWGGGCSPTVHTVYEDNFDDPIDCDISGWTITNGSISDCYSGGCSAHQDWYPALEIDQTNVTMQTSINAAALDDEVLVCYRLGMYRPDGSISLYYNAGSGDILAHQQDTASFGESVCWQTCVNLSDIDPAVNNNPDLGLQFVFNSPDDETWFYGITVTGVEYCAADPVVSLSQPPLGDGFGNYDFSVTDVNENQLTTRVECVWEPDPDLRSDQSINFLAPFEDWGFRRKIVFNNVDQTDDLTNFPVLVRLSDSWFDYGHTQDLGEDIRFIDSDLAEILPHEIEKWDEGGASVIWVRVPHIPGSSNEDYIWMYYGNAAAADSQNPGAVWEPNFIGVWHLAETEAATTAFDSSLPSYHGTYQNGVVLDRAGGFDDRAVEFDGDNDRVNLGGLDVDGARDDDGITIEVFAWNDLGNSRLISKADGRQEDDHWWMLSASDNGTRLRFRLKLEGTTQVLYADNADLPIGDWFYAVGAYDGDGMQIYTDGSPNGSNSHTGTVSRNGGIQAWIGSNPTDGYETWNGFIGEVRISNIGRSPDWIAATWLTFSGTFVTIEDEIPL
jgi:uncharacterized protein DUF2341/concanavalin A-like lectin/glucanase superfamily protein